MDSKPASPNSAQREAEISVEVAKELQRTADEARERARAACERAGTLPLFDRLNDSEGR